MRRTPPRQKKALKQALVLPLPRFSPNFPEGPDSLESFLRNNLTYPEKAKSEYVQGKVYIGFMINKNGKIVKPRILSSASEDLDKEALRVVNMMPDWKPGTAGGTPVDVQYILPIDFITPPPSIRN